MRACELCGAKSSKLSLIRVAGSDVLSCENCKKHGREKETHPSQNTHTFYKKKTIQDREELELVNNYGSKINRALAKKGINIQQLARVLNIKESTLNKYVTGKIRPDIETTKKIEKYFEITLLEEKTREKEEEVQITSSDENTNLTLGDLIKSKLKK